MPNKVKNQTILLSGLLTALVVVVVVTAVLVYRKHHQPAPAPETAISYYQKKQYDQAIALVQADIQKQPSSAEDYNFLGNIQRDKGNSVEARKDYQKAIELNAQYFAPRVNLASMDLNLGNHTEANQVISDALKQFPQDASLLQLQKDAAQ